MIIIVMIRTRISSILQHIPFAYICSVCQCSFAETKKNKNLFLHELTGCNIQLSIDQNKKIKINKKEINS